MPVTMYNMFFLPFVSNTFPKRSRVPLRRLRAFSIVPCMLSRNEFWRSASSWISFVMLFRSEARCASISICWSLSRSAVSGSNNFSPSFFFDNPASTSPKSPFRSLSLACNHHSVTKVINVTKLCIQGENKNPLDGCLKRVCWRHTNNQISTIILQTLKCVCISHCSIFEAETWGCKTTNGLWWWYDTSLFSNIKSISQIFPAFSDATAIELKHGLLAY